MTTRSLRALVASLLIGLVPGIVPTAAARETKTPQVHFLNPSPAYDPGSDPTGSSATPAISDRSDGVDGLYRLVAWGADGPTGARVVAALNVGGEESSIGEMERSKELGDTWELLWDIPDELPAGPATLIVKLLHPNGPVITRDEVNVRLRHQPSGSAVTTNPGPDQGVGITWPKLGGTLGFYRKSGGAWTTILDGVTSEGTQQLRAFYSVSSPGAAPEYVFCATLDTQPQVEPYSFQLGCELQGETTPKQVTAVGFVAEGTYEDGGQTQGVGLTQESADVVRARGVAQLPRDMTISVDPIGRALVNQCAGLLVSVTDGLGRPVQGANVDVHLKGPEGSGFATGTQTSGSKAPDRGKHEVAPTTNCTGNAAGEQGVHPAPEGERPTFHRESTDGSGLSGPDGIAPGVWRFDAYSTAAGFADVTVWLDEPGSPGGTDDDKPAENEVAVSSRLQWLPEAPSIAIDSQARSAATEEGCIPFLARVSAGGAPMPLANVDLDATGPDEGVTFCSPEGADDVWRVDHPQEGTGAPEGGPPVRSVEGDADERGTLLFGLTSSTGGETSITVWVDGESGTDDNVKGPTEPHATRTFSWVADPSDVKLSFLNPSPYGGTSAGNGTGTQLLPGDDVRVAVSANVPDYVNQLSLSVSSDGGLNFSEIGSPQRITGSDVFGSDWSVDLPRGDHTLRVELPGTDVFTDMPVQVGKPGVVDTSLEPLETARLETPAMAGAAAFTEGATPVTGTASAGAEGVDLFYTTVAGGVTPQFLDWVYCGYVDLAGTGSAPQPFEGTCALAEGERAWNVTGISALTVDCTTVAGCNAAPDGGGPLGRTAEKDSGDAVRVYGREAAPGLKIELPKTKGRVGTCHPVNVFVQDAAGMIVPEATVDLVVRGKGVRICGATGGSRGYVSPGHVRLPALLDGSVTVDIISTSVGRSNIIAWLDEDGDGAPDATERDATARFNWIRSRG